MRKVSYGEGVERVFPIYSPQISKIEVSKYGDVRRSKLYYLRKRSGKSARITEKNKFTQQNKINGEVVTTKKNNIPLESETKNKSKSAEKVNDNPKDSNQNKKVK